MNELIKITQNENGERLVSARELYEFLEVSERFSSWFDRQLKFGFEENVDFVGCKYFNTQANQELQNYVLKLDMAKELSMLARSERGKQARLYFIECEKQLTKQSYKLPSTFKEALIMLVEAEEIKEKLILENSVQKDIIDIQSPKAEYFDALVESNLLTNFRDTAKELKIKETKFIEFLLEKKYIYRDKKGKLKPSAQYVPELFQLKEFTVNGYANTQTKVTTKGREVFRLLIDKLLK